MGVVYVIMSLNIYYAMVRLSLNSSRLTCTIRFCFSWQGACVPNWSSWDSSPLSRFQYLLYGGPLQRAICCHEFLQSTACGAQCPGQPSTLPLTWNFALGYPCCWGLVQPPLHHFVSTSSQNCCWPAFSVLNFLSFLRPDQFAKPRSMGHLVFCSVCCTVRSLNVLILESPEI
jgi:hypothetical protein